MRSVLVALAMGLLGCAAKSTTPAKNTADPTSLLPEKRMTFYWKKGCDDPNEEIGDILGVEGDATVLWRAKCSDGRVLRCSYHRLMKCRWEKVTETATSDE